MNENENFILVDAENLSFRDEFMQWTPQTQEQSDTKNLIFKAIRSNTKNFYIPHCSPSYTDDKKGICFVSDKTPAIGRSYNWWEKVAKEYQPDRNSRLGTRLEYAAFLGVLIKRLVEEGKSVKWAWYAVCNNSKELGHYWNSENTLHKFESTGSRCICGFHDLSNLYKILADDNNNGLWLASGCFIHYSYDFPIATFHRSSDRKEKFVFATGWIVLEK